MISNSSIKKPLVFKITGNSTNDGPGIRSVVFIKGCPLSCVWCHNPESQNANAELWWDKDKCIGDFDCIKTCMNKGIDKNSPGFINRDTCITCLKCVDICPSTALNQAGNYMSVEKISQYVIDYKPFYEISGGGVTISGGEPTLFMDFTSELLKSLKHEGIQTLVETSGHFDLTKFKRLCLPYIDVLYMDVKLINSLEHKRLCGVGNEIILENFIWLNQNFSDMDFEFLPRIPLIPGLTDTDKNISDMLYFFIGHKVKRVALLPNNPLWFNKNTSLGYKELFNDKDPIRQLYNHDKLTEIKEQFYAKGIDVVIM